MIHNNLELLQHSRELMIEIHKLTLLLSAMPIFREAKYYKPGFIKYLVHNHDVTQNNYHLETLFQKGKLTPENFYAALKGKFDSLSNIINGLKQSEENETSEL